MKNLQFKLSNLKRAAEKLEEVCKQYSLEQTNDITKEIIRDSIIQRFEFTYELTHKTLQEFFKYMGIHLENSYPRTLFKKAYTHDLISDDNLWLALLEDRNSTSHIYSEKLANEVVSRIQLNYMAGIKELIKHLEDSLLE